MNVLKQHAEANEIKRLRKALDAADAVIVGAGSGLSTSAGFTYSGERFEENFSDFSEKYGFTDMYSGGFYPFKTLEEKWAYWSKYIYLNRYTDPPKPVYNRLKELIEGKDYFVLTTNVDHCFQKAGFDKHRLFYTQGDYGLFQCSEPCCQETFDNEEIIRKMVAEQKDMRIPHELIPICPHCGKPMTTNLRADSTFVEDKGWHEAARRCDDFIRTRNRQKVLLLELGVGYNTPGIVKYNFWQLAYQRQDTSYACINFGEAFAPDEISAKSICINGDIGDVLNRL